MQIRTLSIVSKLVFGFGIITLISILLGIFSIIQLQKGTELTEKMFQHPYAVSNAVKDIHVDLMSINELSQRLSVEKIKEIVTLDTSIQKKFDLISKHYLGPKDDVKRAYELYDATRVLRLKLIDKISSGSTFVDIEAIISQEKKLMKLMHHEIKTLSEFTDNKAAEFFYSSQKKEQELIFLLTIAIVIFAILSIFIAVGITKSILSPLHKLIDITKKIIDGKLDLFEKDKADSLSSRDDEIAALFNSFSQLMTHLLLPYQDIIKSDRPLVEKTDELRRLLKSFDKYVIASKTDKEGIITYVSKAFIDISGYTKEELIGKKQNIVRHPETPSELYEELWKTIKHGHIWKGEIKI